MAEQDLSFPLVPVHLPELPLEQGPGDLAADDQFQMDDDEMKLLVLGPKDENHLPSIFGLEIYRDSFAGLLDCGRYKKLEDKSKSEAEQMHLYYDEVEDYVVVPSLLDLLPVQYGHHGRRKCRKRRKSCWANDESNSKVKYDWGGHHGRRKCRKKSTSCWAERSHMFGLLKPSACGGTTFGGRKKIERWTSLEAQNLVKGVSIFGVGNWTKVKRAYFETPLRQPRHLKDKWRDFVRACGIDVGSKKEVHAQRATLKIMKGLEEEIKRAAQNKRAPVDD